jgi:hypothetical protein
VLFAKAPGNSSERYVVHLMKEKNARYQKYAIYKKDIIDKQN